MEAGAADDFLSRCYDIISTIEVLMNVMVTLLYAFGHIVLYTQERIANANRIDI